MSSLCSRGSITYASRLIDVLLVNQTANTLQNLCLDFAVLGDLKIVERPAVYTIAPHNFQSIKATIKVNL
jgi:coatomer subunit beta